MAEGEGEGISSFISTSLSLLEKHEKEYMGLLNTSELECIMYLKLWLQSLERFYDISNNEDLKRSISEACKDVMQQLQSFFSRPIDGGLVQNFLEVLEDLVDKIQDVATDPKTDEVDLIFLNTFFKTTYDFVLKSLRELSSCKADRNALSIKEKKILLLHDLLAYIGDSGVRMTEENDEEPLFELVCQAKGLLNPCLVGEKKEQMELEMMLNLSNYVKEIYMAFFISLKLQGLMKESVEGEIHLLDCLMKLLDYTSNSSVHLNDVCEKLHDKLRLLKTFLADLPHEVIIENFIHLSPFIENITSAALHILCLCYHKEMKKDQFSEENDALAKVLYLIEETFSEVNGARVGEITDFANAPEIKLYNYPKTDALGFLDMFLGHVEELLKCQPELIKFLKNEIETLKKEFDSLRYFLKQIKEHEGFEDIRTDIIHLAYQAEFVIDSYLVKSFPNHRIKFTLSKIVEKIKLIQSEVTRINEEKKYVTRVDNVEKASSDVPSRAIPIETAEVVGFEDEAEKIKEFLVGGTKKQDVVSIVGMAGLGKTTLARKIFEDPLLIEHFEVRAWCTVSYTYHRREVLLAILGDIIKITEEFKNLNDEDLAVKLYQSLKRRRYLIVIDDLWDIEAWNDLARPFPDDKNHSRIIITSRLHNVASQTKVDSKVHFLREFSNNESWELFEKKLFQNKLFHRGSLSKDIEEVGRNIVESCKGLPLAIVVIASLLSKEKSVDKWKEIALSLSSHILREPEDNYKAIFELSYNHLPDHLKSCLLYFGAFAEDEEILLSKLKWLWIAEGFVRETNPKKLEDLAEEYCMDLISRSLVTPTKERSRGGVKACRVHDLVHGFCLEKAQQERFLQVIWVDDEWIFSSIYDQRRLIINSDMADLSQPRPSCCSVRSLLNSTKNKYTGNMSLFCKNFNLLRVLDLGGVEMNEYFSGIEILIHLKYLAIKASLESIPSSISNLWNLQFFIFKTSDWVRDIVSVPDSIWDMVHLRNVHITGSRFFDSAASFEVHPRRLNKSVLLDNLESLATPRLCYGEDAEELLRRLPKLEKLSCIFYIEDEDDTTACPRYPVLDFLDQLLSLKVTFDDEGLLLEKHIELKFPSNLKKVTLKNFQGYWDDISRMGRILPNLEVLKLDDAKPKDDIWVLEDGDFSRLKYLKLDWCTSISKWICSEEDICFPVLEKLVLKGCYRLKEIPPHFGDLTTLEMISVTGCYQSLYDSVREVQMNREEIGNSQLKVYISR